MDRIIRRCCQRLEMDNVIIYHVLRWTGLIVGCMAHLIAGSMLIFSVYQNDLKETFNYTQTEVERQSSMLGAGFGMCFTAGIFFDKFGPAVTSLTGLLIAATSYALLWTASVHKSYYLDKSWLTAVFFFTSGLGSVFFYMVGLSTNVLNFGQEHRSKVVGLLDVMYSGCPVVVSILYYKVIQNSSPSDSFGTCVLLLCISFGVIGAFCMLCLRVYTPLSLSHGREVLSGYDELENCNDTDRSERDILENDESSNQHLPLKDLLQDVRYWLLLGIFTFECTAIMVYINNVTVISKSNGFSEKDEYLVLILFINEAVFGLIVGSFSDLRKDTITKPILLLLAGICAAICVSLTMIWGQYYLVFCISTFLCGFAAGIFWTICPAAISEIFYVGDVGRNLGIAMSMGSLLRWIVQEAFGFFYDDATQTRDIYCTAGKNCVRFGLLILLLCSLMSIICCVFLIYKINRKS